MYLIRSTSGGIIIFEDDGIIIIHSNFLSKSQKLILAVSCIIVAVSGILLNMNGESTFALVAFLIFLIYWTGYFIIFLFRKKDPEQMKYSEISKIEIVQALKSKVLKIYPIKNKSVLKIRTKRIDQDLAGFLESKNLISQPATL